MQLEHVRSSIRSGNHPARPFEHKRNVTLLHFFERTRAHPVYLRTIEVLIPLRLRILQRQKIVP